MASSISRKLYGSIFSKCTVKPSFSYLSSSHFCTKTPFSSESDPLSDVEVESPPTPSPYQQQGDRPLQNGMDIGVYKAILVGQVGQPPVQKKLRSGRTVTLLSLGTGGIRNNRRPLDNEDPKGYANRCSVQWHRVSIYPDRVGEMAFKNIVPGNIIYVEGNLESKVFTDPITGLVRRIREIALRRNVTVTSSGAAVSQWVNEVLSINSGSSRIIVGLDCEWKPNTYSGDDNKTATLQLCVGTKCLILQLMYVDFIPQSLHGFLSRSNVTFVGVEVGDDVSKLRREYGLSCANAVDIQALAMQCYPSEFYRKPGLKELAARLAGLTMAKPIHVCRSNWEVGALSLEQIEYACIDAYASCKIGERLLN